MYTIVFRNISEPLKHHDVNAFTDRLQKLYYKEKEGLKMMYGFGTMIQQLKKSPKTIVFTEGTDPRILEAASRLLASSFLHPILVGNEEEVLNAAEEAGYNIRGAQQSL